MKIDYTKKITTYRKFYKIDDIDSSIESDRGRVISSATFRRLQNRTQVFSLELNSAVRSRLTHSLEVQQTARYIAKTILKEFSNNEGLEVFGLEKLENAFTSMVEISSLMHDIGNPPFGHFAEVTFDTWMENNIPALFSQTNDNPTKKDKEFNEMLMKDLCNFDGNAQAIRIIEKLQRYNLSYSQVASVLKYTRGAYEETPDPDDNLSYLRKKPGFFYSEKEFVEDVGKTIGMKKGTRFPLTYIMEAADDISYLTADLEDAVDKGIFTFDEVYEIIIQECQLVNETHKVNYTYLSDLTTKAYEGSKKEEKAYQFNLFLTLLRAKLITDLVSYVSKVFIQHHEQIFRGEFNCSLLEYDTKSKYFLASEVFRNIAIKNIYTHKSVETLQLQAYQILSGLFDVYKPILEIKHSEIKDILAGKSVTNIIASTLFKRLSTKHVVAYQESIKKFDESLTSNEKASLELYYRARLLIDYISGMTDDYALHEYHSLLALKI